MNLKDLGFDESFKEFMSLQGLENLDAGRVIAEHKERYIVVTEAGEFDAEITGNMRFTAKDRSDFPAVGDWVAVSMYEGGMAIIHRIFPRKTILSRQAVGKIGEAQVIAANIDYALITLAAGQDFNINRVERYLTICHSAKVSPVIILSKTDLIAEAGVKTLVNDLETRIKNVPIIPVSNQTRSGYDQLSSFLTKGKTYCFLGSSGVGKSTLINNLTGKEVLKTKSISESTGKGKHTTSHRELFILENGSLLIDNPGMREVGIADTTDGLEMTFDNILELTKDCKFSDCTHTHEKGCAVTEAVEKGIIDRASYENYLKMEREKQRFRTSHAEKRKKDKAFGKFAKQVMEYKKRFKP
ncbi:MAG TPA: ribosome small subunit-dependent GTPase A [Cyclobacteriaceae bacterium]|nr:ribosome small subunit-dependent GTPase A [Cyclobacteriaceae bacterium]